MPEERKAGIARTSAGAAEISPSWLVRNGSFVRAICLILCYVSAMLFIVAVVLIGAFTLLIGMLLGIFIASVAVIVLLRLKMRARS